MQSFHQQKYVPVHLPQTSNNLPSGWRSCQTEPRAKTSQQSAPLWVVRENNVNGCNRREKSQRELHSPLLQHLHSLPSHQEGRANPAKTKTNIVQNKEEGGHVMQTKLNIRKPAVRSRNTFSLLINRYLEMMCIE